jgi:hypothetical protein
MLSIQIRKKVFQFFLLGALCVLLVNNAPSQSSNSEYPTPVITSEVAGKIEPRDVGDPRLTRHFFTFNGTNGDLNITIESENLNGDVDVFTVNGLRPLTKVSIFDTGSKFVTTASVYMRKREALLLRVEARTASDNIGSYRIIFSGGFEPVANAGPQPVEPKVNVPKNKEGTVRVNAVGARIEEPKPPVKEKPAPPKTETTVAKAETKTKPPKTTTPPRNVKTTPTKTGTTAKSKTPTQPTNTNTSDANADSANASSNKSAAAKKKEDAAKAAEERRKKAAEARAAEAERKRKEEAARVAKAAEERKKRQEAAERQRRETIAKAEASKTSKSNTKSTTKRETNSSATAATEPAPDPMASVRLVVETKDGTRIERRMNEVRRVNVEKGVLVVVFMDGKIEKIPMANVARMAIEP